MEILIKRTWEFKEDEWNNYAMSFNSIFKKNLSIEDFKHKYNSTILNHSFHCILVEYKVIVGAFTIIPYEYYFNRKKKIIGLAVDVFIVKSQRKNPLLVKLMYQKLKTELRNQNIEIVVGVPNDQAYPYWKSVLKWKDIGNIPYYILIIRAGNLFSNAKMILNLINTVFIRILFLIQPNLNKWEKNSAIHINKDNPIIEKQRYTKKYKTVVIHDCFFSYRIVNEKGILTCYLIDFYHMSNKHKNQTMLKRALKYIISNEIMDIIVFVGTIHFRQWLLFKVPFKKEPKHLYFTRDVLSDGNNCEITIDNLNNWDFGLFNYDVR